MCDTCGCNVTPGNQHLVTDKGRLARTSSGHESVEVLRGLLDENDVQAQHNRQHFDHHRVLAVNLMSSPGSGKTSFIEATTKELGGRSTIGVIEGDLETENDAARLRKLDIPAIQISTGTACHLDAHMVHSALHQLTLDPLDILFVENVGNLVCPASFDLGQHVNVVLLSVTEGDDKPEKYPVMFRAADLVLIAKSDLRPAIPEFNVGKAARHVRELGNDAPVLEVSAKTGRGMNAWLMWLEQQRRSPRSATAAVTRSGPPNHATK